MIAALSPLVSWLIVGWILATILLGAWVAGAMRKRWPDQDPFEQIDLDALRYDPALFIRVRPGVYDWQARGDFE